MSAPWPSLVFVEGLPGSGKSTTAQWIAHEMLAQGRSCRWTYEEEMPHPVLGEGHGPHASWKEFFVRRLTAWASFAAAVASSEAAIVVDSTLLQSSVFGTLRRGVDPETILVYLDRVADLVRPLDPALVYFAEGDPDAAFRTISERRGMAWTLHHVAASDGMAWAKARALSGFDGLLAYWREHARICDTAVTRLGMRTLSVAPEVRDWPTRRRHIAEFLGLSWPPTPVVAVTALSRYLGHYRSATGHQVRVSSSGDDLVMEGLLWWRNRLLPRAPHVFAAESWPYTLSFEADASGDIRAFRLDGPALAGRRLAGLYEKLGAA